MFIIDVRLNNKVENLIASIDQRLITGYTKASSYENGFYILGYTGTLLEKLSFIELEYYV